MLFSECLGRDGEKLGRQGGRNKWRVNMGRVVNVGGEYRKGWRGGRDMLKGG